MKVRGTCPPNLTVFKKQEMLQISTLLISKSVVQLGRDLDSSELVNRLETELGGRQP